MGAPVHSQEQAPQLLFRAAQCLAAKNFLPLPKATRLTFGYLLDEISYQGERVIYLVAYAAPAKSSGLVFALFLTEHDGHQEFNIQNNANFALSKDEFDGVSFISPPTWQRMDAGASRVGHQADRETA